MEIKTAFFFEKSFHRKFSACTYLPILNNGKTRQSCEISSKLTLYKKWAFSLRICWGFGHLYRRNPSGKTSFFVQRNDLCKTLEWRHWSSSRKQFLGLKYLNKCITSFSRNFSMKIWQHFYHFLYLFCRALECSCNE